MQFDRIDLAERGCAALAEEARRAGADSVQIERCDFYLDGEARAKALETLAGEIRFFEDAGFPVALWITSLGYGRMTDADFLRWQKALLRSEGIVPMDENDPYPRDTSVVPAELCESYDRAMIAEGGIIRNKYILRHNAKTGKGIDPAYFAAHMAGREEAKRIAAQSKDAKPHGFEVFAPPHLVRDAVLPTPYAGMKELLRLFAQPLAGILLASNGAPTRYDRDSGAPLVAFGPAAATLPVAWLKRGVVLDRDGAAILRGRGIDTGDKSGEVRRIGEWSLSQNADGEKFAICDKGWMEINCGEANPDPVPVNEIWRFFTIQVSGRLP